MRNDLYTALDILNQSIYEWIEENTDERDRLINFSHEMVGISMRDTERNILNIFKTLFDQYTLSTNEHYWKLNVIITDTYQLISCTITTVTKRTISLYRYMKSIRTATNE